MPRVILIFGVLVAIFVGLLFFSGYLAHQKQLAQQKVTNVPVSSSSPSNDQSAFFSSSSSATQSQGFAISSTIPANNATSVLLNTPIVFSFNRSFESSQSAIQFSPDSQFSETSDSNTVTAVPNPALQPNTQYKVTINVPSQNYSYSLNFTTINASPTASASASPQ